MKDIFPTLALRDYKKAQVDQFLGHWTYHSHWFMKILLYLGTISKDHYLISQNILSEQWSSIQGMRIYPASYPLKRVYLGLDPEPEKVCMHWILRHSKNPHSLIL
jgi:hypothetical protein